MENKRPNVTNYPQNNIRNRAKQRHYIGNGLKVLIASPLKGVLVLLFLAVAFLAAWRAADTFIPRITTIPLLIPVVVYAVRVLIPTVFLLLLAGFLWLLGAPAHAREIENDLAAAFGIAKTTALNYRRPFLISSKPLKGSTVTEYVFWSRWIDLDQWNKPERRNAVLWALNAHSGEEFSNGKKKYTVVIRAGSGAEPERRETPHDPLFM